jgi:RecA-family ATPase
MELTQLLDYIPASSLDYQEWVNVGMALKHEGLTCDIWDAWSRSDSRYKSGECARKWKTFREDASTIVTGGTIYELAKRYGYKPEEVKVFDWDDEISDDGDPEKIINTTWLDVSNTIEQPKEINATDELRRYIQALFKPDEIVGFCIDAQKDEDRNKWTPASKGAYGMTAKAILNAIKKHPDDIKAVIGDYNEEAGAWIRFNPLDGAGVSNQNVTELRYALVESDTLEIERQKAIMEELQLPIAVMLYSGGKSIHAIVKVDAVTVQDYREKVDYLYRICEKNGLSIDKQNKNPSRMSRMPGVKRGDKNQYILAENIGLASFDEWKEYIEDSIDTYPDIVTFSELQELPALSPEIIHGILRKGHKMLISGASKAGKSFLLIELAICITTGRKWLGFQCEKGRVLYVNLEVDGASFLHRVRDVQRIIAPGEQLPLDVWNLRGEPAEINRLAPRLIRRAQNKHYDLIILDPLYKINEGEENSATDMAKFFNQLDRICKQLGVSIACCHHHSKGAQGGKFSIDRASGSGVFARDPDALLDMIRLNPIDAGKDLEDGQTAWRISATLREFPSPDDIDVVFDYPVHHITEDLKEAQPMSGMGADVNSQRGNAVKGDKAEKRYTRLVGFVQNWDEIDTSISHNKYPTIQDAVEYFKNDQGFSERTIRRAIEKHDDLMIQNGVILPKSSEP